MNDDERIRRLTELARRVWPDRDAQIFVASDDEENTCVVLDEKGDWEQHLGTNHPRALDALEAALLVLAGESDRGDGTDWHRGFAAGRRYEVALANERARARGQTP